MFTIQEIPKPQEISQAFGPVLGAIVIIACFGIFAYLKWGPKAQPKESKEPVREPSAGDKPPEYWQREFDEIKSLVEESKQLIHDFTVRREPQWDNLNEKLDRINQKFHDLIDNVAEIDAGIKLLRDKK